MEEGIINRFFDWVAFAMDQTRVEFVRYHPEAPLGDKTYDDYEESYGRFVFDGEEPEFVKKTGDGAADVQEAWRHDDEWCDVTVARVDGAFTLCCKMYCKYQDHVMFILLGEAGKTMELQEMGEVMADLAALIKKRDSGPHEYWESVLAASRAIRPKDAKAANKKT